MDKDKKVENQLLATIDNSVPNFEKHPFFIRKAEEAKAYLKIVGLPRPLRSQKQSKGN